MKLEIAFNEKYSTASFIEPGLMSEKQKKTIEKERTEIEKKIISLKNEIEQEELESKTIFNNSMEWRFEYPEVLEEDGTFYGFDIVIGNPPYGVSIDAKYLNYIEKFYKSSKTIAPKNGNSNQNQIHNENFELTLKGSKDTFSLFLERGLNLLKNNSYLNFIVPLAITSSESLTALHKIIFENCELVKISSYSNRPSKIFDHADQRVAIIQLKKTGTSTKQLLTTKVNKRYEDTKPKILIDNLQFVDSLEFVKYGRIPKVGSEIELQILRKIFSINTKLKDLFKKEKSKAIYYRAAGGRYYNIVTDKPTGSTQEKALLIKRPYSNIIASILSSNLYYSFLHIYSDNLHIKSYELEIFPVPIHKLLENKNEIEKIYKEYLKDLQKNSIVQEVNYSNISEMRIFYARKSKNIIDNIDLAIQEAYGLTDEEVYFLINYDLKFRTDEG